MADAEHPPKRAGDDLGSSKTLASDRGERDPSLDATEVSAQGAAAAVDEDRRPGIPTRLGRYVVISLLGEGGMGRVYAAYDPDLDRKVALKVILGARSDAAQQRLFREAQAMAKLAHENVVPVYDVGTVGRELFVAMRFVDGVTIRTWLEQDRDRSWRDIVEVFIQAGRGLAAAHDAGLVHRDFKPDNTLVSRRQDGSSRVQVLDFGLAKAANDTNIDAAEATPDVAPSGGSNELDETEVSTATNRSGGTLDSDLTEAGARLGTPRYMAPEQHRGGVATARSDQFSFCVALHEALFGQHPFPGDSRTALAFNVTRGKMRPIPPNTTVPHRIAKILERGLATDPDARWPNMHELLAQLQRDPVVRRNRWLAVGGLVCASMAVGFVASGSLRTPEVAADAAAPVYCQDLERPAAAVWNEQRRKSVREAFARVDSNYAASAGVAATAAVDRWQASWIAARTDACKATRIRGEQSEALMDLRVACLDRRLDEADAVVAALGEADGALVQHIDDALAELPDVAPCSDARSLQALRAPPADERVRARIDQVRADLAATRTDSAAGRYDEAAARIEALIPEAEAIGYDPLLAEVHERLGLCHTRAVKDEPARDAYQAALWPALRSHHDAVVLESLAQLVFVTGYLAGDRDEGLRWSAMSEAMIERLDAGPRRRADAAANLAQLHYKAGNMDAARSALERAIQARARAGLEPRVNDLNTLGGILLATGEYTAAKAQFERALALAERDEGPDHPDLAFPLNNLALAHERLADYDQAVELMTRTLALLEGGFGPDHPNVGLVEMNIGGMLVLAGHAESARPHHERALAVLEAALGPDHQVIGRALTMRADWELELGEFESAEASARRALSIRTAALGADHPDLALSRVALGRALLAQGRLDAADGELTLGKDQLLEGDSDPVDVGLVHRYLADLARARGDLEQAGALRDTAIEWFDKGGPTGALQRSKLPK